MRGCSYLDRGNLANLGTALKKKSATLPGKVWDSVTFLPIAFARNCSIEYETSDASGSDVLHPAM